MKIDGSTLEVLNEFIYLGVVIVNNGRCRKEVENHVVQGRKFRGTNTI